MSDLPVLHPLVGLLARPLPLAPLAAAIGLTVSRVADRHARLFDRLGENARKRFAVVPTDLPMAFVLQPDKAGPRLEVVRDLADVAWDARIAGPFLVLVDMLRGRLDGDALFFSRDIVVEGDVEAVVALRNALDAEAVDVVADTASLFGPLASVVAKGIDLAELATRRLLVERAPPPPADMPLRSER